MYLFYFFTLHKVTLLRIIYSIFKMIMKTIYNFPTDIDYQRLQISETIYHFLLYFFEKFYSYVLYFCMY